MWIFQKKPAAVVTAFLGTLFMFAILILTLGYLRGLWNKTDRGQVTPVFELPEDEKHSKGKPKGR